MDKIFRKKIHEMFGEYGAGDEDRMVIIASEMVERGIEKDLVCVWMHDIWHDGLRRLTYGE